MEKSDFNKVLGEFVRYKREERKWTQPDLATKLNTEFQSISRVETGNITSSLYWINLLAEAFDTTLPIFIAEFDTFRNSGMKKVMTKKLIDERIKEREAKLKSNEQKLENLKTNKMPKSMDELTKGFEDFAAEKELTPISKEDFEKGIKKLSAKDSKAHKK